MASCKVQSPAGCASSSDKISQLPVEILDHILGFLPVQEAARTAVLSKVWRDVWSSLSQLCFLCNTDYECPEEAYKCDIMFQCSNAINKVLLQHRGSIKKLSFHFPCWEIRTLSFDMDKWLLLVTQRGVEDIYLRLWRNDFKLPDCIFSCSTLKTLRVEGFFIEPRDFPCVLPNVTSLYFEYVRFGPTNLTNHVIDVPKLENLSFIICEDMFVLNITTRNLRILKIKYCSSSKLGNFLPVNLDLRSLCTLDVEKYALQGLSLHLPTPNVELLKLSKICIKDGASIAAFASLLCKCPKLCNLEVDCEYPFCTWETSECMDAKLRRLEKLRSVLRTHKLLSSFKLSSFEGWISQMNFIKEMLACLPALEKVVIIACPNQFDWNKARDTMEEILHLPRASGKARFFFNQ